GYLICTHLVSSLSKDTFTFGELWARRALRILPSYLLVICVSIIAAAFILVLPSEFFHFGQQAAYSAAMLANHYFLGQQGYFDGLPDTKPLLHLWSLSVEEQFYLAAPVILFSLYALSKRLRSFGPIITFVIVAIIFGLSLYGCTQLSGGG